MGGGADSPLHVARAGPGLCQSYHDYSHSVGPTHAIKTKDPRLGYLRHTHHNGPQPEIG